jgi:hypothetical protein
MQSYTYESGFQHTTKHYQLGVGTTKMKHCTSLNKNRSGFNTVSLQQWGKSILSCARVQTQVHTLMCKSSNTNISDHYNCASNAIYREGGQWRSKFWCFMNAPNKIFWIIHISHYSHFFSSLVQTILFPPHTKLKLTILGWNKIVLLNTEGNKNTQMFLKFDCHHVQ